MHHKIYFHNYEHIFHSQINPEELPIFQIVKLSFNISVMELFLLI